MQVQIQGIPAGAVFKFAGSTVPGGYLACDGSAVSRATYAALFAAISTVYGTGDGSTTFNLPDTRGRAVIGSGQGSGLTNRALGATGGEETHPLTIAELATHDHGAATGGTTGLLNAASNYTGSSGGSTQGLSYIGTTQGDSQFLQSHTHSIAAQGSGTAHNNMQPFIAFAMIIKF